MIQEMYNTLDKFFSEKTVQDVDRNTFLVCNLNDMPKKITISLIFIKDWHTDDYTDYNELTIKNKGAVFTFPSYWVSVPKELAITYFQYIIDKFYEEEVSKWDTGIAPGGDGNNNGCGCPCQTV